MNDDLISRKALKRAIKTECNPYGKPTIDFESGKKVLKIIDNAPTVTPEKALMDKLKGGEEEVSKISEVLSVAYDSGDEDISCLVVARKEYDKFTVLNEFYGEETDKLYHELVEKEGSEEE